MLRLKIFPISVHKKFLIFRYFRSSSRPCFQALYQDMELPHSLVQYYHQTKGVKKYYYDYVYIYSNILLACTYLTVCASFLQSSLPVHHGSTLQGVQGIKVLPSQLAEMQGTKFPSSCVLPVENRICI